MGIKSWLARKGAVGSTARWAGKCYWMIKRRSPTATVDEVMRELILARYGGEPMKPARDSLVELVDKGEIRGLAHLVANILSIEASYQDNTHEDRFLFMDVIIEELDKLKIPSTEIYDPSRAGLS